MRTKVTPRFWRWVHAWHVVMGEHCQDAGGFFGGGGVDRQSPAIRYSAGDDRTVQSACEPNISRIARRACYFDPPIDAGDWLSDGVHARAPAIFSARSAARCASSTLKALWASGRASVNDVAIAALSA